MTKGYLPLLIMFLVFCLLEFLFLSSELLFLWYLFLSPVCPHPRICIFSNAGYSDILWSIAILLAQSLVPRRRGESLETRLAQRIGWTDLERDITNYAYFTIFFPLMIHKVGRLCKEVPIDNPSKCPCAEEWDGMTLETWKHQTLWTNGEKCVWVSQVVTICTLGTVISLSLKLTSPNYLNLEGKLYWNSENHEIYMAQYPCISRKEWFAC